jgi:cell division protein ZapA
MSGEASRVSVKILEKEYQVTCPVDERPALLDSAAYLNRKMREIRDSGKVIGLDRIAVMAALNIVNELLTARGQDELAENDLATRLKAMRERVENVLTRSQPLGN